MTENPNNDKFCKILLQGKVKMMGNLKFVGASIYATLAIEIVVAPRAYWQFAIFHFKINAIMISAYFAIFFKNKNTNDEMSVAPKTP